MTVYSEDVIVELVEWNQRHQQKKWNHEEKNEDEEIHVEDFPEFPRFQADESRQHRMSDARFEAFIVQDVLQWSDAFVE